MKVWPKEDADHFCNAIRANFRHAVGMEGKNHRGLTIDWHYKFGCVDVSMPKHVTETQKKLLCKPKKWPQHSPRRHTQIQYGQNQ